VVNALYKLIKTEGEIDAGMFPFNKRRHFLSDALILNGQI